MDMSVKYRLLYTTTLTGGTQRGTVPAIAVFSYHVGEPRYIRLLSTNLASTERLGMTLSVFLVGPGTTE